MIIKSTVHTKYPMKLDVQLATRELIAAAQEAAPVGAHTHDAGVAYGKWWSRGVATLKTQLGAPGNWKFKATIPGMSARVTLHHWGASMLEFGANVAAVVGNRMAWNQPGKGLMIRGARKGFRVSPRPFSPEIMQRFFAKRLPGGTGGVVHVWWKRGKGAGTP